MVMFALANSTNERFVKTKPNYTKCAYIMTWSFSILLQHIILSWCLKKVKSV